MRFCVLRRRSGPRLILLNPESVTRRPTTSTHVNVARFDCVECQRPCDCLTALLNESSAPCQAPPAHRDVFLIYDRNAKKHRPPATQFLQRCIERPQRILFLHEYLQKSGILEACTPVPQLRACPDRYLRLVHQEGQLTISKDTYLVKDTLRIANRALGTILSLLFRLPERSLAFALVRPPGHHAEPGMAMGFCFYNYAAVAAVAFQEKFHGRVAVVDWDIHFGNGTYKALADREDVLFVSLHRYDNGKYYPNDPNGETGVHGNLITLGWNGKGCTNEDYRFAFERLVLPLLSAFRPAVTIISAGFDAVQFDPVGECKLTPAVFGWMAGAVSTGPWKTLFLLEGGYNIVETARSVKSCLQAMLFGSIDPELRWSQPVHSWVESEVAAVLQSMGSTERFVRSVSSDSLQADGEASAESVESDL